MLSADAARLAFAKGLHRAAPPFQGLTEHDVEQRNRIFWAIYCLEKQIANQSGRSSVCTPLLWHDRLPFPKLISLMRDD